MATATLIKGFTHDGKIYKEGDQFEGSDYEIELLTRQKFVAPPKDKSAKDAGNNDVPGKGVNTSESSSESAHVNYPAGSVPGQQTSAQTSTSHQHKTSK